MFENIISFFKKFSKENKKDSKDTAKERLHLVLMQDRANVSADFLELMKQEIIEVIKKYIDVDENSIDVKLTNKVNADGTTGAPALYANIPIVSLKDETKKVNIERKKQEEANDNEETVEEEKEEPVAEETVVEETIVEENVENIDDNKETVEEVKEETAEAVEEIKEETTETVENVENNEKNVPEEKINETVSNDDKQTV